MPTTPPPPGRVHTPPTPLHGPRYDNYEPYSPRRSTRVAAKREKHFVHDDNSSSRHRSARASTPVNQQSPSFGPNSSQTYSPPSSPHSPTKRVLVLSPRRTSSGAHKSRVRASPFPASDSDTDVLPSKVKHLKPSSSESFGMFHTPAKTPRKRPAQNGAMNGTARALFRPAAIEDAMPTPKKSRKAFNPFAVPGESEAGSSSKIEIYTDSKDRVPTLDEDDANPFLSKNAAKPNKRRKNKAVTEREEEMEEAVRNEEGLVYVFRGKKTLRRFDDGDDAAAEDEDDNLSDLEVRRKAGAASSRPFTRSTIKPRLLFPSEEQRRAREAAEEADEEAVTDIEVPQPKAITPVKQQFLPTTPPSTGRTKRGNAKKHVEVHEEVKSLDISTQHDDIETPSVTAVVKTNKKISPFGGWSRKKGGSSTSSITVSKKREGEPLARDAEGAKRTRSGAYSAGL